jgi:Fic family protein
MYRPSVTITPVMLKFSENIFREIGRLEGAKMISPPVILRRSNKIKTIHASLAIEGNTLTIDQITDLLEGKHVIGPPKEIVEVKNALLLYEKLQAFNPRNLDDLLRAHQILMQGLIDENGYFRTTGVGVLKGNEIVHMAPPDKRVPDLMQDLFEFINEDQDMSWLLKSCIFHFEFEFIHPFIDGNGRMGRLWQQLLLMKEHPVFAFVPVEEQIKINQARYYDVLEKSGQAGESTIFVEFALEVIFESLISYGKETFARPNDPLSRLTYAQQNLSKDWFGRKDYLAIHPDISMPTASRDLTFGLKNKILVSSGEKNQVRYRFVVE